ncbi:hypothetical protein GOBAR_AA12284 [Gossypium barbadense]|uniref:Cytochrome b n=1 Tax=Gossypium barbadense TaxID=3634 RepID=A0A2P5XYD1_GOSBA|nr:hypothetical protein GOBAR_AA12284 [Gossypium barbadense]
MIVRKFKFGHPGFMYLTDLLQQVYQKASNISRSFDGHKEIVLVATTKPIEQGLALQLVHKQRCSEAKFNQGKGGLTFPNTESSDSNLAMLMEQDNKIISLRVLERRESGKNLSSSVTEQPDDSSVTQDDPFDASFAVYPLHPSKIKERIVTGVFLAMHYTPHVDPAFNSVEHVMRDVKGGWLLRYMHANGATFIGYVLPWGQMSFWGATVITSLASVIPVAGDTIVTWLWGGFFVNNATLNHFFSLHHLLRFILVGTSLLHLAALHQYGSNNPLGVHSEMDKISFYPYFYVKDLVSWVAFAIFFSIWIFYAPNVLGHPDNYIPANPIPTPPHIVAEWYFLPIHAILRSIPDKSGGVAAIAPVFICLLALPFFKKLIIELDRKDEHRAKVAIARDFKGAENEVKVSVDTAVDLPLLITSHRTQNGLIVNGIRTAIPSPTSACMLERRAPLASDIFYGPLWKLSDQSSLASKAVYSVSKRKCAFLVYCNSSPLRGRLGHDVYDILLGVLPHYRDPTLLLVLGKMPQNFKVKREETCSMVGLMDEAITILLDSKPNGD